MLLSHGNLQTGSKIIGVDPGLSATGWGVVEKRGGTLRYCDAGTIRSGGSKALHDSLRIISRGLEEVIRTYSPDEAAVENIFFARSARNALMLGHARGVILASLSAAGVDIHEYSPLEIKKALVGYGRAGKNQISMMVKNILKLTGQCDSHSSDALAVAICHFHSSKVRERIAGYPPEPEHRR